jgi:hypothetical protein
MNPKKTMANCNTAEFLRQSNKIRHAVAEYLDFTKILDIRKNKPVFTDGMTDDEKKAAIKVQAKKNISAMLDNALEENAEATTRILALLCFVDDAEEAEKLDPFELLDVILSERVLNFFTRLMQSGLIDMADTSQKSAQKK